MENKNPNDEIQKYFGDKFTATQTMSRFEVMLDHFSKKFTISRDQAKEAYEKTRKLYDDGKNREVFRVFRSGLQKHVYQGIFT